MRLKKFWIIGIREHLLAKFFGLQQFCVDDTDKLDRISLRQTVVQFSQQLQLVWCNGQRFSRGWDKQASRFEIKMELFKGTSKEEQ